MAGVDEPAWVQRLRETLNTHKPLLVYRAAAFVASEIDYIEQHFDMTDITALALARGLDAPFRQAPD